MPRQKFRSRNQYISFDVASYHKWEIASYIEMSYSQWADDVCLRCEAQTHGAIYCSEACRLAEDNQKEAPPGSASASTGMRSVALARTKEELRAYNTSLNQSKAQKRVSR
jgi:hypothetical protein